MSGRIRRIAGYAVAAALTVALCAWAATRFDDARRTFALASAGVQAEAGPDAASSRAGARAATALGPGGIATWTALGPSDSGGPVSDLKILGSDPNRMFAMAHRGDVFGSADAGAHWAFLSHLPLRGAKLELASGQPQTLYAWARPDAWNHAQEPVGSPIQRSTDGGATWSDVLPADEAQLDLLDDLRSFRVLGGVSPSLWITTGTGLYKSIDGGARWTSVYAAPNGCGALEVARTSGRVHAVCVANLALLVTVLPDGTTPTRSFGLTAPAAIAIAPSDDRVIYLAWFERKSPGVEGWTRYLTQIQRSQDAGASWAIRYDSSGGGDPVTAAVPGDFDAVCQYQGTSGDDGGERAFQVDPADPERFWIAGNEAYRSDDGGHSFGRVLARSGQTPPNSDGYQFTALAFPSTYDGAARQTVYLAGARGVERTVNARAAAQTSQSLACGSTASPGVTWSAANQGLAIARLVHGERLPSGATVVASADTGVAVTGNDAAGWVQVDASRTSGRVSIDPRSGLGRFLVIDDVGVATFQWTSSASKWVKSRVDVTTSATGYRLDEDRISARVNLLPVTRAPGMAENVIATGFSGVFQSIDSGQSWKPIGLQGVELVGVAVRRNNTIVAGGSDGYVYTARVEATLRWEKRDLSGCLITPDSVCNGPRVAFSQFVLTPDPMSSTLYALGDNSDGAGASLWRSADGLTWTALTTPEDASGLPTFHGSATIAVDLDNPRHLYLGTAVGLFASDDEGRHWSAVQVPFAGTPISHLQFVKRTDGSRELVAYTYGRGAWLAPVASSTTFLDVPTYSWAYDAIQKLYLANITTGCTAMPLRYCGSQPVRRDQMAVFLLRAQHGGGYAPPAATGVFADVPTSYWAAPWIEQLRVEGITDGCARDPDRYCPDSSVLRGQMAVLLLRAKHGAQYVPPAATGLFADVPISDWAAPWIEQLSREGISSGCSTSSKRYCPADAVTREQMAVLLVKTFGL